LKEWVDFFYYVFLKRVYKINSKADIKEVRSSASYHITLIQSFVFIPPFVLLNDVFPEKYDISVWMIGILSVLVYIWSVYLLEHTGYYKYLFEKYDHLDPFLIAKRRMKVYLFNWSMYILSYSTLFFL
jgi:hypothetical protein